MSKFYDVHAHLFNTMFKKNIDSLLKECEKKSVTVITMYDVLEDFPFNEDEKILLSENVEFTMGAHPLNVSPSTSVESITDEIEPNLKEMVGIGEIGMDYSNSQARQLKEEQEKIFRGLLKFAEEHEKPVIIHSRGVHKKVLDIMGEFEISAVMHAFPYNKGHVKTCEHRGYYFSISPIIFRATHFRRMIRHAPLEKLVVESDAPFLSKDRAGISVPTNIIDVANVISSVKRVDRKDAYKTLAENTEKVFTLS